MKTVVSFRPAVASRQSAFECQSLIYEYLQKYKDYRFKIIVSEDCNYEDSRFDVIKIPTRHWKPFRGRHFFWDEARKITYLQQLCSDADLILTVDPTVYPQAHLAFLVGQQLKKPVWFDTSITLLNESFFSWSNRYAYRRLQRSLKLTTGILATTPKCIERFQHLGLLSQENITKFHVLGHPVDTERFKSVCKKKNDKTNYNIVCVSRLVPEKGIVYILEAFCQLAERYPHIRLQLVGEGPLYPALVQMVQERGITDKVTFSGMVPHEKLPSILQQADLFVNHALSMSYWEEFFGAANLEAMACGLPTVLTQSGGISYAIRKAGVACFVPERSIMDLANTIEQILTDDELSQKLVKNAQAYVSKYYSLPMIADRFHWLVEKEL